MIRRVSNCGATCLLLLAWISRGHGLDNNNINNIGGLGRCIVSLSAGQVSLDDNNAKASPAPPPDGFHVEHNVVSEETWKILRNWLLHDQSIPWEVGAQNRTVAQFGFRYNYDASQVEFSKEVPPIPLILRTLLLEECATKVLSKIATTTTTTSTPFTQCIINVYHANDIIPWHWDHVDFGPTVLVFTFDEARPLRMRRLLQVQPLSTCLPSRSQCHHHEGNAVEDYEYEYEYYTATPRHGSCYVLSGPSRYQWEHSVPTGSRFRLSITFRTHHSNHVMAQTKQ
jgi:alkylated DNA repair dioxygenase AlkB